MTDLTSFRSIIALWPSREAMAADVGAPVTAVTKWGQRNSIPADWWAAVLATSRALEAGLSAEILTALAAREVAEARA
jgi:hypothetical protein